MIIEKTMRIGLDNIDYKEKFNKIISSLKRDFDETDLDKSIVTFIENNFNKVLLFTHSLHPSNVLLYELWRSILNNLNIDITQYDFDLEKEIIDCWYNPFTTKMIKDLNIQFETIVDDNFYIERYNLNKDFVLNIK